MTRPIDLLALVKAASVLTLHRVHLRQENKTSAGTPNKTTTII